MTDRKCRVKNTDTGNFVSEILSPWAATKLCAELLVISDHYEVVEVDEQGNEKQDAAQD